MPYVKPSAKEKLQIWMTDGGGQSCFDHEHVESLKKNLGEILVCHMGGGGQSSFDHVHVESLKNSR